MANIDDTMVCDSCKVRRLLTDFADIEVSYDPGDPSPVICTPCKSGVVSRTSMVRLTDLQQQILHKYVAERKSPAAIAKDLGCSPGYVSGLLNARSNNQEFRRAMRLVLEESGVDLYALARSVKESLAANKHQWHPEDKEFVEFPDNTARGSAQERIAKLFALYEKDMDGIEKTPSVAIQIVTNVGSNEPYEREPGTYVIEATPTAPGKLAKADSFDDAEEVVPIES